MPSLRLFLAIETPPQIKSQLSAIRDMLRASGADVRWEQTEKLHATLKFLGNTDESLLPEIVSYIRRVGERHSPLRLKYGGLGCFPNHQKPRIIWIGMEDQRGNLSPLQKALDSALFLLGFKTEERTFHPHVTIGRVKSNRNMKRLLRMMESATFESQPVEIREISVIRSTLSQPGSIYSSLEKITLGAQP